MSFTTKKTIEDAVLNDKYSWNSLYVYLKYKVKDTKKLPFIDTMSISLDSPHTLHISVYEKRNAWIHIYSGN